MNNGLQTRVAERDRRLERLLSAFWNDNSVRAAWFLGSLGRGDADAWSDIDLWIVLTDQDFERLASQRHQLAKTGGGLIGWVEAEQNAPPGGAYLHALYGGSTGLHVVDLYLQRFSSAKSPPGGVLFEKERLSASPIDDAPRFTVGPLSPKEDLRNRLSLAASMIAIQAKYFARNPQSPLEFASFICQMIGSQEEPPSQSEGKVFVIRELLKRLEHVSQSQPKILLLVKQVQIFVETVQASLMTRDELALSPGTSALNCSSPTKTKFSKNSPVP